MKPHTRTRERTHTAKATESNLVIFENAASLKTQDFKIIKSATSTAE